jgi:flagellar protein FliO/FliZ
MGDTNLLALMARLLFSLAVVIGLLFLAGRFARKRGIGGVARRTSTPVRVDVLARTGLGRNASVAVVRAGGRSLVVGVTEHTISLLGEADIDFEEPPAEETGGMWGARTVTPGEPTTPGSAWKLMLEQLRDRTARRR